MRDVEIYSVNDSIVVVVKGSLNMSSVHKFQEQIDELFAEEIVEHLILDLSEAEYVSSVGLKVILELGKRLKEEDGTLSLVCTQPLVREIFEASGFTMLFGVYGTVEEAQEEGLNHRLPGE